MLEHEIECGSICDIRQIASVPPNTGWIEQSYQNLKWSVQKGAVAKITIGHQTLSN